MHDSSVSKNVSKMSKHYGTNKTTYIWSLWSNLDHRIFVYFQISKWYYRNSQGSSNVTHPLHQEKVILFLITYAVGDKTQVHDESNLHRKDFHTYNLPERCELLAADVYKRWEHCRYRRQNNHDYSVTQWNPVAVCRGVGGQDTPLQRGVPQPK